MAIDVDVSHAYRRPSELVELVEAVYQAHASDEAEWIEWKSTLALDSVEGCFSISRQILGFANRRPDRAARFVGGLGYLIVGVAPGTALGVDAIDVAQLDDSLQKYLGAGAESPVWAPTYLVFNGKTVLVIVVEAPSWGDAIHVLHKTFQAERGQGADNGTIFVRGQADTERATAADIKMLQDRLTRGREERSLELALQWADQEHLVRTLDTSPTQRKLWLAARRKELLAPLAAAPKDPAPTSALGKAVAAAEGHSNFILGSSMAERRTRTEFTEAVDAYLAVVDSELPVACVSALVRSKLNLIKLAAVNPTSRNLPNVEITLHVGGKVSAYDSSTKLPAEMKISPPPWPWGKPKPRTDIGSIVASLGSSGPRLSASMPNVRKSLRIENGGSVNLTFEVGDLRPKETRTLTPFNLVTYEPPGTELTATWTGTSTGVNGVHEERFTFRVAVEVVSPFDLI
jgi:hypothetical protein